MGLDIDNSFENATAVQQRLGWTIIKGWGVYELQREPAATSPAPSLFVAHKRWWNAKPSGVWVDLTPRIKSSEQLILIESQLADKQAHFLSLTHSSHTSNARRYGVGRGSIALGGEGRGRGGPALAPLDKTSDAL